MSVRAPGTDRRSDASAAPGWLLFWLAHLDVRGLLARLALGVAVICLLAELATVRWPDTITVHFGMRIASLLALTATVTIIWVVSLFAIRGLRSRAHAVASTILASRLRTWAVTFVLFELVFAAGRFLEQDAAFWEPVPLVGSAALACALALLLAPRPATSAAYPKVAPPRDAPMTRWPTLMATGAITIATLGATYLELAFSLPRANGPDSYLYFLMSQSILGRSAPPEGHFTYAYPLVISVTRLFFDHVTSIMVLQHGMRIVTGVTIFLALRHEAPLMGLVAALLVAIDPVSANLANNLLTESLYTSFLVFMALMAYRLTKPQQRRTVSLALALGALAAWVALFRPAGLLLVMPTIACVALGSRSWRRPLGIVAGFTLAVVVLAVIQWRLMGAFGFGTRDDIYYAYPYVYHELFDPNNGPRAAELYTYLTHPECAFEFPESREAMADGLKYFPHFLHTCSATIARVTGLQMLPTGGLYFEGIRAAPAQFAFSFLDEMRHFVTHSDWIRTFRGRYISHLIIGALLPEQCKQMLAQPVVAEYGCMDFKLPGAWVQLTTMWAWYWTYMDIIQPYRLQGIEEWPRALAVLLLTAFVVLESSSRVRWLVLISLSYIAYHAAVTSFAQWTIFRYVYCLSPFFAIIVAVGIATIWQGARSEWRSRAPVQVGGRGLKASI